MELSGHGKEKICQAHFRDSNFICSKLSYKAIGTVENDSDTFVLF